MKAARVYNFVPEWKQDRPWLGRGFGSTGKGHAVRSVHLFLQETHRLWIPSGVASATSAYAKARWKPTRSRLGKRLREDAGVEREGNGDAYWPSWCS